MQPTLPKGNRKLSTLARLVKFFLVKSQCFLFIKAIIASQFTKRVSGSGPKILNRNDINYSAEVMAKKEVETLSTF